MDDLQVIDDPDMAIAMLDPLRREVLRALREPGSASSLAASLDKPRQRINYHLRALEDHKLVALIEERPRRGLTERVMQASARSYVISPDVLGDLGADPTRSDHMSAAYLLAAASRTIREVGSMLRRAEDAGKTVPTITIDTSIRFASPATRKQFSEDLASSVAALASTYHDESASGGRWHRLVFASHPRPAKGTPNVR